MQMSDPRYLFSLSGRMKQYIGQELNAGRGMVRTIPNSLSWYLLNMYVQIFRY